MMQASDRAAEELEIRRLAREQDRARRSAVQTFARSVRDGDIKTASGVLGMFEDEHDGRWATALSACARLSAVPTKTQRWFLKYWCEDGDQLRRRVNNDRVLIAALRVLLPPYHGPAVTLYRGERMLDRRRRNYGPGWSVSEQVADGFARGESRAYMGGSVVLRTVAPPEAIVCVPALHGNAYKEEEYVVDQRRLAKVDVVRRYSEMSYSEMQKAQDEAEKASRLGIAKASTMRLPYPS